MSDVKKYRKKPVMIEAMQFTGENAEAICKWANGDTKDSVIESDWIAGGDPVLLIYTLEGVMIGSLRDFIIKGISGEFYPCKPDIFAATYDEA